MQKHSYSAVRLFVNQIAISIFGLVLAIACGKVENETLKIVASVGAILFYLFLIYAAMWEVGSKDKFGIENGKIKSLPLTGLYIALIANTLNIILAVIITLSSFAPDGGTLHAVGAISSVIALFIEGMYTGILSVDLNGIPLNDYWLSYFIIIIPSLAVSALAYWFGVKGYHFSKILIPENPEDAEIIREKKNARNNKE
jgi:hypothetical protein